LKLGEKRHESAIGGALNGSMQHKL
jgi:hypothetical protein